MRNYQLMATLFIAGACLSCGRGHQREVPVVEETYVHKYGVEVPSDFWSASGQDGSVITTMGDGVVITRSYNAGNLEGTTSYSYPHSEQLQKTELYSQGTMVKSTLYYFQGTPKQETLFDSPIGFKSVSTWYLSGTPRSVEQFSGDSLVNGQYFSPQNQQDATVLNYAGTRILRDDYGQLVATDTIVDGKLALRTNYHANGSPKEMIPYTNNVVDGTKKTFYPAGEPATIEQWSQGRQNGLTTVYKYGEKSAEVPYANGVRHGTELRYKNGQAVVQEISWANGVQHGPMRTYVGDNVNTEWYYKGEPSTQIDFDFLVNKQGQNKPAKP
jgi:antitoxin component YwqK of YwqJK toxin-antitoxin module